MADAIVHEPDCEGFENDDARVQNWCKSICALHYKCEPRREGDFLLCGECWHVYRTPKDLVDAYIDNAPKREPGEPERNLPAAKDIFFCPHCLHDF